MLRDVQRIVSLAQTSPPVSSVSLATLFSLIKNNLFALLASARVELVLRVSLISVWLAEKDSTSQEQLAPHALIIAQPAPLLDALYVSRNLS